MARTRRATLRLKRKADEAASVVMADVTERLLTFARKSCLAAGFAVVVLSVRPARKAGNDSLFARPISHFLIAKFLII